MESICFRYHLTWQWQQCVHIHDQNMLYHIGNVFCVFVYNYHGLIFQVQNHISTIQILAQSYVFMSINAQQAVLCMADSISMKRNSVTCVRLL